MDNLSLIGLATVLWGTAAILVVLSIALAGIVFIYYLWTKIRSE